MRRPISLDERLRIQRWIAAIGLMVAAEDGARVDTPETNALALLGAHAACETLLGLLAGVRRYKQGDEYSFPRLLDEAAAQATLAPELMDDLEAIHRARNRFVHASNAVHANETARAIADLGQLPPNAGIATAVSRVIDIEAVGMWLRHADEMLATGHMQLAADGCARALDSALSRTHPILRQDRRLSHAASDRDLRWRRIPRRPGPSRTASSARC